MAEALGNLLPRELRGAADAETWEALSQSLRYAVSGDRRLADAILATAASRLHEPGVVPVVDPGIQLRRRLEDAASFVTAHVGHRVGMQRDFDLLMTGSAAERERFLDDYFYDLRPPRDDWPFFFNYYKSSRVLESTTDVKWYEALPEFPVGHMVLWSSLIQILVLASVLILLPLRLFARVSQPLPSRFRVFLYFAMLGIGFMLIEISLMQKYVLFLGHPTASLSVVLSGLLASAGLGALCSARLQSISRGTMRALGLAVVVMIAVNAFWLDPLLASWMGLPYAVRVVAALFLIAPAGFVLGFPFPLGIRVLEKRAPIMIPWGWAINGFLSVFGSLLAILLAMALGFTHVLIVAAVLYAIGFALFPVGTPVGSPAAAAEGP